LTATSGVGYGDSNMKVAEAKQDWMRMLIKYEPQNLEWYTHDENGEVKGFNQCSYDVEDFIVLDLDCSETPEQVESKYLVFCCKWTQLSLDIYFVHVRWTQLFLSSLSRAPHSVSAPEESLLSSPVSCHATSFYPNRAPPLRRKDGDDLHENVDHGEILPNPDGTFQMSVDLNLSSVKPEDWGKYDLCDGSTNERMFTSCEEYLSFTENKQLTIVLLLSLQFLQLSTSSSSSSPIVHRKLNNDFLRVFVRLLASHM
uniref:Uncharacterized protein n=1 Tax=Mola mola TaxID=94237 RepID=A0A3Q4B3B8_MOLML